MIERIAVMRLSWFNVDFDSNVLKHAQLIKYDKHFYKSSGNIKHDLPEVVTLSFTNINILKKLQFQRNHTPVMLQYLN